jgi:hypothetical protein
MTKTLTDLSPSEAASLALEIIIYGQYLEDVKGRYEWSTPYTGSWEDYLLYQWSNEGNYYYAEEDSKGEDKPELITDFDEPWVWQQFHSESSKGERDSLTAEVVASHGGEGEGDQYWMVISISDGNTTRFLRKDGYYASYDGGYLDSDTSEVKPKEKMVTFYE